MCYTPAAEAEVMDVITHINMAVGRMSYPERRLLADHYTLVDNAANTPDMVKDIIGFTNTAMGGVTSAASMQSRVVGDYLRNLERAYVQELRTHGKLTSSFYAQRRRIYQSLDSAIGRLSRTLTMGTSPTAAAKHDLKIKTKSQLLYWKRHGTGDGTLRDFKPHFDKMDRIARHLRRGGYLAIGVNGYLTYDTITQACKSEDDQHCQKTALVESAGFAGSTGLSIAGGGMAAYGLCNMLFSIPSTGTSLLWCSLVAGAAGGFVGGEIGKTIGRGVGNSANELLFENGYR